MGLEPALRRRSLPAAGLPAVAAGMCAGTAVSASAPARAAAQGTAIALALAVGARSWRKP